jgi:hypothetical protein
VDGGVTPPARAAALRRFKKEGPPPAADSRGKKEEARADETHLTDLPSCVLNFQSRPPLTPIQEGRLKKQDQQWAVPRVFNLASWIFNRGRFAALPKPGRFS